MVYSIYSISSTTQETPAHKRKAEALDTPENSVDSRMEYLRPVIKFKWSNSKNIEENLSSVQRELFLAQQFVIAQAKTINDQHIELQKVQQRCSTLEKTCDQLEEQLKSKQAQEENKIKVSKEAQREMNEREKEQKELRDLRIQIYLLEQKNNALNVLNESKETEKKELQRALAEALFKLDEKQRCNAQSEYSVLLTCHMKLAKQANELRYLENIIAEQKKELSESMSQISSYQNECEALQAENHHLKEIINNFKTQNTNFYNHSLAPYLPTTNTTQGIPSISSSRAPGNRPQPFPM